MESEMSEERMKEKARPEEEIEIQVGGGKSIARNEILEHLRKQHPQRDVPRIDGEVVEREE